MTCAYSSAFFMAVRIFMKLISWNVNGLRACAQKGFGDFFQAADADLFAVQETKCQPGQIELDFPGYESYYFSAQRKGYSGVAVFSRRSPLQVIYGLNDERFDSEGRVLTLEFDDFYFVTSYTPNSQSELVRLDYRLAFEDALLAYLDGLNKHVILCGDLNVAHEEIDLKNPAANRGSNGFSDEERACLTRLLSHGYIDTYRYFYPEKTEAYSWWSYRFKAREHNAGWRIDYFIVDQGLDKRLVDAKIYRDVTGSDHCPVGLELII